MEVSAPARPKLLVVEDDAHVRELVTAAANQCGLFSSVTTVADGQAALDLIRRTAGGPESPDFVLSDLSMPRLDGIALARALKHDSATRQIPIAIMTSSDLPNDRTDALAAGCCAFFEKPVGFDALGKLVRSLLPLCRSSAA